MKAEAAAGGSPEEEFDLRSFGGVLARRWKLVAIVTTMVTIAALVASLLQTPTYRVEAEVLMRQIDDSSGSAADAQPAADSTRRVANEVRLMGSGVVIGPVSKAYHGRLDPSDVKATAESDTSDVVRVSLTTTDPDEGIKLVNTYIDTFVAVRQAQRTSEFAASAKELQTKIEESAGQISAVRKPLDDLDVLLATDPKNTDRLQERAAVAAQLAPKLNDLETRQSSYEDRLSDIQLSTAPTKATGPSVLTRAATPDGQIEPKTVRNVALALALGLVLGVAAAFVAESLDDLVRSSQDLARVRANLVLLASLPLEHHRDSVSIATRDEPVSHQAEAFRQLRSAVRFSGTIHEHTVIQVTSASQGEGKTTVVANLAVAFAQGGAAVAVVCCDLRRPRLHLRFDAQQTPGLSDVLLDEAKLSEAVQRVDLGILLLASGALPSNPAELLERQRAGEVIAALRKRFDIVLIDSPPVLPVTDAAILSKLADATIVVVDARSTRRSSLADTLEILDQADASVMGAVLNRMPIRDGYGYNTKRSRTYVSDPPSPKPLHPSSASTIVTPKTGAERGRGIDE